MTDYEIKQIKEVEKRLNDLYWVACRYRKVTGLNTLAADIEALAFTLACIRGYDGD